MSRTSAKAKKSTRKTSAKKTVTPKQAKKVVSKGRPRATIKEKLQKYLQKNGEFTHLQTIYKYFKATSAGQKAGIRGLLNRGCKDGGIFVRNESNSGEYKAV